MTQLKLPKLKKIQKIDYKFPIGSTRNGFPVLPKNERKTILLLGDDMRMHSGIATMSKEFVTNSCHYFNWINLGGAIKHPEAGKVIDLSRDTEEETGVEDVYTKLYPTNGYGNQDQLRQLIAIEKPDGIVHFTDPRFWLWLYQMAPEFNAGENAIPLMYYNIWDDAPPPMWNKPFYESCDSLFCISKQTMGLVKTVLGEDNYRLIDENNNKRLVSYIPHGVNHRYKPLTEKEDIEKLTTRKKDMFQDKEYDFIVFWNNRNIRRKQPGDVILGFKHFCDKITAEQRSRCLLLMHTQPVDENGTDLPAVCQMVAPDCNVMFSNKQTSTEDMNLYYNMADITVNIASNEGFGLGTCESLRAGTPIVVNVTGGLQDQCGFKNEKETYLCANVYGKDRWYSNHDGKYKNHGEWVKPVFPSNRSLQGSVPTPYIFDDRAKFEDLGDAIYDWYKTPKKDRIAAGMTGHEYVMSTEADMSGEAMGRNFMSHIDNTFENFTPRKRFTIYK